MFGLDSMLASFPTSVWPLSFPYEPAPVIADAETSISLYRTTLKVERNSSSLARINFIKRQAEDESRGDHRSRRKQICGAKRLTPTFNLSRSSTPVCLTVFNLFRFHIIVYFESLGKQPALNIAQIMYVPNPMCISFYPSLLLR